MPAITLDAIEAKQTELSKLIAQFKDQANQPTLRVLQEVEIELHSGEHYAGPVLDADGNLMHHLVLRAELPTGKITWQAAMDWADSIGGALPTRQEQALLFANCKTHVRPEWHWSSQTHEDDASFAWICYVIPSRHGDHLHYRDGRVVCFHTNRSL